MATATTGRRKWVGPTNNDTVGCAFNPRLTRAYGEGRRGIQAGNPHVAGSPANIAWGIGSTNTANPVYIMEVGS